MRLNLRNHRLGLGPATYRPSNSAGSGGAAAFSPASLFASGEQGAWYDPSDFSTMWVDRAGTTPVTAAGQVVGRFVALDNSGVAITFTAPNDAARALLQESGGYYSLLFDGVNDAYQSTAAVDLTSTDKLTIIVGALNSELVLTDRALFETSAVFTTQGCFAVSANGTGANRWVAGATGTTTAFYAPSFTHPAKAVLTCNFDIAGAARAQEIIPRINGVLSQSNPGGAANLGTGNFSSNVLNVGARNGGASAHFKGNLYSFIIRGAATTGDDLTNGEAWVNSKTGAY